MRQTIIFCDGCNAQISTVYQKGGVDGEFCLECMTTEAACTHENNISDATNGKDTARVICKDCGYDRVEAVEEILTV